jgi:hypothetical protein
LIPFHFLSRASFIHRLTFTPYSYILLYPLLLIFVKSSTAAAQSVLHVLFLPTPFKVLGGMRDADGSGANKSGGAGKTSGRDKSS